MGETNREELAAAIALMLTPGVGSVTGRQLVTQFGSAGAVLGADARRLLQVQGVGTVIVDALRVTKGYLAKAEEILAICEAKRVQVDLVHGPDYPALLREVPDAPLVLYRIGRTVTEVQKRVAVVGTRKNTAYGKSVTEAIVKGLAHLPVSIVSGLAFGIDTIAHKAALDVGLHTTAVMATAIDKVYPSQNRELAVQIYKQGCLFSEYAPGSPTDARNFPMRNRIVAGLCEAVIVVEANLKGGALITARLGLESNREVFAVPGPITAETSTGCHELIRKSGGQIFMSVDAFLEDMNWVLSSGAAVDKKPAKPLPKLEGEEMTVYTCLMEKESVQMDDLSYKSGVALNRLSSILLKLEFDGLVKAMPGKKFAAL